MNTTKTLISDTREALESDRSAVQLDTLHTQLKTCIRERSDRIRDITAKDKTTFGNTPGPERQKVIASGDFEALLKLDEEELGIASELQILHNLQGSLRRRLDEQRAIENVAGMPGACAELNDLLTAQAEAAALERKAKQVVEAKLKEILSQRDHVTRQKALHGQNVEMPVAASELLDLYIKVNQYRYFRTPQRVGWFSPTDGPQQLKIVAGALGLALPHPESVAA